MDESVYPEEEANKISVSPYSPLLAMLLSGGFTVTVLTIQPFGLHEVVLQISLHGPVGKTASSDTSITPPVVVVADLGGRQSALAVAQNTVRQLHDSAASKCCDHAEQTSGKGNFLTRKDTANINDTAHIFPAASEPAPEQAESAFVQMPPFEARKTFLLGPPRPACCPERSKTADGINKLRQTDDPDIGRPITLCTCFVGSRSHTNTHLLTAALKTQPRILCLCASGWADFSSAVLLKAYAAGVWHQHVDQHVHLVCLVLRAGCVNTSRLSARCVTFLVKACLDKSLLISSFCPLCFSSCLRPELPV